MSFTAPRSSYLGAMRVRGFNTRFHGGLLVDTSHGPAHVPAYSQDSETLVCGFSQAAGGGEGSIWAKRTPDKENGSEFTSLKVNGGSAWCPTNNKFYSGAAQLNPPTNDGMAVAMPADSFGFDAEPITGFTTGFGVSGGRAFFHPDTEDIWVVFGSGGNGFARIDPSSHAVSYVTSASPSDFTYGAGSIWTSTAGAIYKISSGGSQTLIFDEAALETLLGVSVNTMSFGPIEYIDSVGVVIFLAHYFIGATEVFQALQINTGTNVVSAYASAVGGSFMYYSPQFDRIILHDTNNNTRACTPNFSSSVGITEKFSAAKGCFCDNINKVALPVLASGAYTVKFYSAADLGA
jgi:hypothetical protein